MNKSTERSPRVLTKNGVERDKLPSKLPCPISFSGPCSHERSRDNPERIRVAEIEIGIAGWRGEMPLQIRDQR